MQVLDTTLNDAQRRSLFSNCSGTVTADGGLWVAGGRVDDTTPGDSDEFPRRRRLLFGLQRRSFSER